MKHLFKTLIFTAAVIGSLTLGAPGVHAQAVADAPIAVASTTPPKSFWGDVGKAGQAFIDIFKGDTNAMASRTWIAGPFVSYDIKTQKVGGGVVAIYPIKDLPLYIGGRLETIGDHWVTPSIQLQLKTKITVSGYRITPYAVGGTAIVDGNVAAYTGIGGYINFWDFTIKGNPGSLGCSADYEKWGGLPDSCGTERVNVLPILFKFTF